MATYQYLARTIAGKMSRGRIEARDENEAKIKLRARQLMPLKLEVDLKRKQSSSADVFISSFLAPRLKSKDLQIFTRQFATLINSGIPILDSIRILSEGSINKILKEALIQIRASIESGRRLSESMIQHPRVFDRLYCNLIQAGEEAGILDTILSRLSMYIEKNEKIKRQVKSALVMPIVITFVAFLVIGGIIFFIIPKFQEFYAGSGKALPALTMAIVNLSMFLRQQWHVIILSIVGVVAGFTYYMNTLEGQRKFDEVMINAPLFGDLIQKSSVARMSRTLSTLLSSGIGLIEAIEIAARTSGNYVIEKALIACRESVTIGRPFHQPLAKQKEIPIMVSQMVAIGEQSGTTDVMLAKIADFYEDEVENAVKTITALVEPLLMVVLGGIIAVIMVAMYLPIFGLADTMGGQ
ncbi:MAG: pilus assembly protein PilC [Bdellovibrionales bacterium RIFCSPHIGHO2_01_FULL_40_29]|nr:MAG: pilus assembly protein PilC [Bdellovibrionales bacterium RIFCSPHIGHO2_01_FULL_40_29]OFZ32732.1 MAG: pilus assembly protein PilC [Bdellovibrionales bacterium RIFCSPHIGHO2_02_FULL_40_15]